MDAIGFEGQVAIVTGAGGGLGRSHALELARRGARVVVNDLGAALDGSGGGSQAALGVVEEIRAAGGEAIANGSSVTDDDGVARMVQEAMDAWGRVDVLVANAGIIRDKSFAKMDMADFGLVLDVHLMGTVKPARAVWEIMRAQGYGRIVVTTSAAGLYGNFGQTNYAAAKLGLVGFMNTLKLEGAKNNIHINAIAPMAATRMMEGFMAEDLLARLTPQQVSAGVVYLCSQGAPSGAILAAGAGVYSLCEIVETRGCVIGAGASAEEVRDHWAEIADRSEMRGFGSGPEEIAKFMEMAAIG